MLGRDRRDLSVDSQQRSGRAFDVAVRSELFGAGWTLLMLGTNFTRIVTPGFDGVLWTDNVFWLLPVAPRLNATWANVTFLVPSLPAPVDVVVQPLHLAASTGRITTGSPATLTVFNY